MNNFNNYSSLVDAQQQLIADGYTHSFTLTERKMRCTETNKEYSPNDMVITKYQRFEGISNPSDMSIIFAVKCNDGLKGTIISSYGAYADIKLVEFMDKVKIEKREAVLRAETQV